MDLVYKYGPREIAGRRLERRFKEVGVLDCECVWLGEATPGRDVVLEGSLERV